MPFQFTLGPLEPRDLHIQIDRRQSQTSGQLTWTRLPQGFKNSLTLFIEALGKTSMSTRLITQLVLLQYVDDLMLAATTEKACLETTGNLLQTLGTLGYWASAKKAQIAKQKVIYLGYKIKQGWR